MFFFHIIKWKQTNHITTILKAVARCNGVIKITKDRKMFRNSKPKQSVLRRLFTV